MARLTTQRAQNLQDETLQALEPVRIKGALAPVYLQMANSEAALKAYLHMESALRDSTLALKEIEAIKLAVSQHNQCDYCLSVHTVKTAALGIDTPEQLAIRRGEAVFDPRLSTIIATTHHLLKHPGTLPEALLQQLRDVGVDNRALVDIALAISTITFTNLFNHFNDSRAPFAPAPEL